MASRPGDLVTAGSGRSDAKPFRVADVHAVDACPTRKRGVGEALRSAPRTSTWPAGIFGAVMTRSAKGENAPARTHGVGEAVEWCLQ